jgi:hypothetical protein
MPNLSINVIRVGSDRFTAANDSTIVTAVDTTRTIYATVNLTLLRVQWYNITTAQARGREIIDSDGEAEALTDEWTVSNNAIDVFFVRSYLGWVAGLSPTLGPCDKNAKGMDGVVVELIGSNTGQALAHELCHYLGLWHHDWDPSNLMYTTVPNGGLLTGGQGWIMGAHCFVEQRGIIIS